MNPILAQTDFLAGKRELVLYGIGAVVVPGLGDHRIVTTLCPGGKERMRLLSLVQSGRFDPTPLITHRFSLDEITEGYRLFGEQSDGVLKIAIKP